MGMTATSILGYGIKINKDSFPADIRALDFRDTFLNESTYPELEIVASGFAPYEDYWAFVKSSCTKVRSHSDENMEATVDSLRQITEEEASQLQGWSEESNQSMTPAYHLIQYIN